jgi:DNA-binding response OmpR family regulator
VLESNDVLKGRVLIVDDQQASVRLLERMLHGAGYTCVESTMDPRQVCELHRQNRYDLILLDLQMPGLDGFRVLEGLKEVETGSYLSVLVMTAHPGHKERALQAGAKDFVSKPFNALEVLTRVHNLLELRLLHGKARKPRARRAGQTPGSGASERTRTMVRPILPDDERTQTLARPILPDSE